MKIPRAEYLSVLHEAITGGSCVQRPSHVVWLSVLLIYRARSAGGRGGMTGAPCAGPGGGEGGCAAEGGGSAAAEDAPGAAGTTEMLELEVGTESSWRSWRQDTRVSRLRCSM